MPASNVDLIVTLANRQLVNVGAVYAAIWGPFDLRLYESLAFEIQNPDPTQTIDVSVDIGTALAGPWSTSLWNGLMGTAPNTTRADTFQKPGQSFIRLIARSDGVGVSGVTLSVAGVERRLISGRL